MKGVILAGGSATRLLPLTKSINKHLLPVYDQPMIYYPIKSLVDAGINDIMIITGGNHMHQFIDLLGDGSDLNCSISYKCQMKPGGIAEALLLTESYVGKDNVCVILGDNIFEESIIDFIYDFNSNSVYNKSHCQIICKEVDEPEHYGVLSIDNDNVYTLIEKPKNPTSNLAILGLYVYTSDVFDRIRCLKYSDRGELEVTDLNKSYNDDSKLFYSITSERWWDMGVSIDELLKSSNEVKKMKVGK